MKATFYVLLAVGMAADVAPPGGGERSAQREREIPPPGEGEVGKPVVPVHGLEFNTPVYAPEPEVHYSMKVFVADPDVHYTLKTFSGRPVDPEP